MHYSTKRGNLIDLFKYGNFETLQLNHLKKISSSKSKRDANTNNEKQQKSNEQIRVFRTNLILSLPRSFFESMVAPQYLQETNGLPA